MRQGGLFVRPSSQAPKRYRAGERCGGISRSALSADRVLRRRAVRLRAPRHRPPSNFQLKIDGVWAQSAGQAPVPSSLIPQHNQRCFANPAGRAALTRDGLANIIGYYNLSFIGSCYICALFIEPVNAIEANRRVDYGMASGTA